MTAAFTGLAVLMIGARPVFVDVDDSTLTMDPAACERVITPRTRAMVPVHLYGQAADLDALAAIAGRHALAIVEDCCQAHGATARGVPVGTRGIGGAFSFYPTKNLAALGDGGAVITNDDAIAGRIRRLRNGGQKDRYLHVDPGINSRLDELQAAVLRARLPRLTAATARRRVLAARYRTELPDSIATVRERDAGHVYHLFPVRSPERDALQAHLRGSGIDTLIHYPVAMPEQPAFAEHAGASCPVASRAGRELLSLPLHPRLADADVLRVAAAVDLFLKGRVLT
jgi:dTDP-3-amino-3,4,6-trideoxy-alpha-D-glucose transaminase